MARIVVAGSGFAGVEAVRVLGQRGVCESNECLWITPRPVFSFQPLIPAIASGRYGAEEAVLNVRGFAEKYGVQIISDKVVEVSPNKATLSNGEPIDYDYLVLATGARPAFYGVPGAEEHSVPLYSPEEAERINRMVVDGDVGGIAIVGAGFVGVELAAELLWLSTEKGLGLSVAVIDMLSEPLQLLGNKAASEIAKRILGELGAVLLMDHRVVRVEPGRVVFEGGDTVEADLVVWSAGLQGPGVNAPKEALGKGGFFLVDEYLRVPGLGGKVFAVGDAASIRRGGCLSLKVAREAIRSARTAAESIVKLLEGREPKKYEPFITTCFPLTGLVMGPHDGILVIGKRLALRTNFAEHYHRLVLRVYRELLLGKSEAAGKT
ncbi:NAD(P)/FAD-dependent oxidoreductase [Pyrofollis japonicus]|uniref:NAD(P)/FAD-dependent oxidoreductase n=1 Tax=Pyrofollis japonicus TaxID=3060460 RepID=UPI00295C04D4|nr:FAD-dependent oxidoreductase [Pyrofollis japonicus]BEP17775.1 NAD(P)/FAD-dependent oxidoreductase [Pyrofollis japonicus]